MNRRQWMMFSGAAVAARGEATQAQQAPSPADAEQDTPDKFLLQDYRPESIYKVPKTEVKKAKYPVIDVHCHGVRPPQQVDDMVKLMDAVGVEKTVIFTGASTAERFSRGQPALRQIPGPFRFVVQLRLGGCRPAGIRAECRQVTGRVPSPGRPGRGGDQRQRQGLRRARRRPRGPRRAAAKPPKGGYPAQRGSGSVRPAAGPAGPHADDPRMDPLWDKCAQLGMPVNIHVSDPIWSYQPMDRTNDGLMNGYTWMIKVRPGMLGHNELIESLERAVAKHPKTIFIACHLMNLDYDLTRLGQMLDRNPNLYGDISARFAETRSHSALRRRSSSINTRTACSMERIWRYNERISAPHSGFWKHTTSTSTCTNTSTTTGRSTVSACRTPY